MQVRGTITLEIVGERKNVVWDTLDAMEKHAESHPGNFKLAGVYVMQGKIQEAIHELREAIRIEPGYTHARRELHRLLGMLN